ncbi:MAG: thiol-disulfide oxidoreductase DCC family protein [Gemmataceae bacterium]|nr:thiol-disulfide oxidoreductase DCC family protein [Gemmataceae bacterium]
MGAADRVVIFDAECKLCNGWVKFIVAHDPHERLRLTSLRSATGQALLRWSGLPTQQFDTIVFVEQGRVFTRSEAVLRMARYLAWPWAALAWCLVLPRPLRDWMYDIVARHRYRWFGKETTCLVPTRETVRRFLP